MSATFGWPAIVRLGLVQACLGWHFKTTVFALGVANGAFSIAAIASMMRLAGEGRESREGVRMGLWGAAQAVAFGMGGLVGTPRLAYATVFGFEALRFVGAALLAARMGRTPPRLGARADVIGPGWAGLNTR